MPGSITLLALLALLESSIPDACGQNRWMLLSACQDIAGEECVALSGHYAASWHCLTLVGEACRGGVALQCVLSQMEAPNPRINTRSVKP